MTRKNLRNIIISIVAFLTLAFVSFMAFAAIYNIIGTNDYVNGIPSGLTTVEKTKLKTVTTTQTDAAISASKYTPVTRAVAAAKIKAIIVAENAPIPCGQGFTGNQPNCTPIIVPPVSLMPIVDVTKNMVPSAGESTLRIQSTTDKPAINADNEGQFRIACGASHMNNDDPIIYPNQQGASHHHTYFGNTLANNTSTVESLRTTGNSTCLGGTANRSAYWVPSMIDTATKTPLRPSRLLVYYKTDRPGLVVPPPKGLRMIAGDSKATVAQSEDLVRYTCNAVYASRKIYIPACSQGSTLEFLLRFPSCWDGKNLDSPDHKSHMAYGFRGNCPDSHPVQIPDITFYVTYQVSTAGGIANWRLASDNYSGGTGGHSLHGDWMNGWDEAISKLFTENCLKKSVDCHANLLGDGTTLY